MRLSKKNTNLKNLTKKKNEDKSDRKKNDGGWNVNKKLNFFSQMKYIATKRMGTKFKKWKKKSNDDEIEINF